MCGISRQLFGDKLTCRDEKGRPIDWYYLYKLPKNYESELASNEISSDKTGLRYIFISSDNDEKWHFSTTFINESKSFPGQTLAPIYDDQNDLMTLFYNDENPNGTVNFIEGHTKGVLAANNQSGFWLIHSVPKYPNITKYEYPKNGLHYGQSFLCITLPPNQINIVGEQFLYNEPNIYYEKIPNTYKNNFPNIEKVLQKSWKSQGPGPYFNEAEIISTGGTKFRSFAKGRKFEQELYEDLVAPQLNVNLMVESWRLGEGNLPSDCKKPTYVYNIKSISLNAFNIKFKTTLDHSKWAVSDGNPWICVGDINRQEHQLIRGGGTVCQLNNVLANIYNKLINEIENCPKNSTNSIVNSNSYNTNLK
ncbi:deoxyribonuclease-2-beta [Condylostylus longicornis]|uniref:deoxyribonuclease-2-beta n=1 Tax=Condylostylus longicornis TaxID=2530218 RepID=UPI00244E25CF|nr:deoxyribonuclease-2-beta [Condylostylus longicornis]